LKFDYTTIGHVTIDVLADGTRRPGGAAFYSAVQAARLGQRVLIITRGVEREIEALLEPHRDELTVRVIPAQATTTLATRGLGRARSQRVLAWAGPIEQEPELDTEILHLAPVAREIQGPWRGRARFRGLTPQGLARSWSGPGGEVLLGPPSTAAGELAAGADAVALSALERASCAELIQQALAGGALVAITDGARPSTLLRGEEATRVEVAPLQDPVEDLGAGDVFAATLFALLAGGAPAAEAARFAAAAAALRMSGFGTAAIGDRAAIERHLSTRS
jgi:hypothetical protein